MSWNRFNRQLHAWGAILSAVPVLVIIVSGMTLQLKKEFAWIQPPSQRGQGEAPGIPFSTILEQARAVPEAGIQEWTDIERIDIRPGHAIIKVQAKNHWEIQLDQGTGEILQVAYRRSDLIESMHDGSFFHERAKYWVFLPAAGLLLVLWLTGIWLFVAPRLNRRRRRTERVLPIA